MFDVVLYEVFAEEEKMLKNCLPSTIKAKYIAGTIQEDAGSVPEAPLISTRTQSIIPEEWGNIAEGFLTRSTGFDNLAEFQRRTGTKAACGYLPSYCSRSVAEHAVLLMMSLLRKLPRQVSQFQQFERDNLTGKECKGKNLLVVGVGKIGSQIAEIASGIGMNVLGVDIEPKDKRIKHVSLEDGIGWAECVVCALPLTKVTKGMLGYGFFKKAKTKIVFVNISRGEISPLKDLNSLLNEGALEGAGLDVFEEEGEIAASMRTGDNKKNAALNALLSMKEKHNVIFTPHNAFNTQEALERKAELTAEAIEYFLMNKAFPCQIPQSSG